MIKTGNYYELPVPERASHAFLGWFYNGVKVEETFYVTDDVTLTAKWQRYRITSVGEKVALNGKVITGIVRYPETTFDLNGQIYVDDNCVWAVYKDENLTEKYEFNKITGLKSGENKSWVVVTFKEGYSSIYTVVITSIDYTGVFLNQDGSVFASISADDKLLVSSPVNTPKSDSATYEFSHWSVDGERVSFPYSITDKTKFTPVFKPKTYTITYYLDGGKFSSEYVKTYTVEDSVVLPVPEKSLYNFGGWYTSTSLTGNKVEFIESGSYGDKEFYANWLNATEGVEYVLSGNEYHVSKYVGSATEITIPDTLEGKPVTKILANAFKNNTTLTSILLPKKLTEIGNSAFDSCMALERIVIPDTVTTIGSDAFKNCVSLTTVEMSNKVTEFSDYLFYGCVKLSKLNIKNDSVVDSIGSYAFGGCSQLTNIFIPSSVTFVAEYAFEKSGTCNVYIDDLTSWCNISFNGYSSNSNPARNLYLNNKLVEDLIIPETVKEIKGNSFRACLSLKTVTLADSVASIGWCAFNGCSNLEKIKFGNGLTEIGFEAFEECAKLNKIYIDSIESWCKIDFSFGGGGMDSAYCANPLVIAKNLYVDNVLLTELRIPETVCEIREATFWGCSNLKKVYIPDSVTTIGNYAFRGCNNIEEIRIPFIGKNKTYEFYDGHGAENYAFGYIFGYGGGYMGNDKSPANSVEQCAYSVNHSEYRYYYFIPKTIKKVVVGDLTGIVPNYAFNRCDFINEIVMGEFTQKIGVYAFGNCKAITKISVPDSVTHIGDYAFTGCVALSDIYLGKDLSYLSLNAFGDCVSLKNITVSESNSSYKSEKWNLYTKDGKTLIKYAVGKQTASFAIPDGVEKIENYAFEKCSSLVSITIPDSVTIIGDRAFGECGRLASVTIGGGVTNIGARAFENCSSLSGVKIPVSVISIEWSAFRGCSGLTSVTIGGGVTNIGDDAFSGCGKLVEVINNSGLNITKGDEGNGRVAFYALNVKNGGTSDIVNEGGYLFYTYNIDAYNKVNYLLGYVGNDTELTLPNDYNGAGYEIYQCAFENCSSLTSITIGNGVTSIGSSAFSGCTSLSSITIPEGVTSIGEWAFKDCTSLTSVTIGKGVTSIGSYAFYECGGLKEIRFNGTTSEWGAIKKGYRWNYYIGTNTVYCTDGTVEL